MQLKSNDQSITKFNVIECKNHIYIQKDTDSSYNKDISRLLFDGTVPEETYKKSWYKLNSIPKKVKQKSPDKTINIRYELKAGYPVSELTPAVINSNYLEDTEYEEVSGLYERKYDVESGGFEEIPFEIKIIYKKDNFEWIKSQYSGSPSLISQIEFHPDILQEAPQSLSSEEMYHVIRNHVKANINPLVAQVTSDYDFHFEVKRKIMIAEPYSYTVNTNANNKRRKPNWVKKWVESKTETILNLKRKANDTSYGSDCALAPAIYGLNATDLENKVNNYLDNLMKELNKQYKECSHCKGWGVLEVENNEENI